MAEIIDGQYLGPADQSYRDRAAEIVKAAAESGRSLREVALEHGVEPAVLEEALDHRRMARPHE